MSNCPDERRCPQNWLELAVTECPTTVRCHICENDVELVTDMGEFQQNADANIVGAFPVVPCAGAPTFERPDFASGMGSGQPQQHGGNGAVDHYAEPAPYEPEPEPEPEPLMMYVTLLNGDVFALDKDTCIVGRSRTCDVIIPSAKVSRQHASVVHANGEWFMEDLGSANGVWREGEKITRSKIESGDVFSISEETLTFELR